MKVRRYTKISLPKPVKEFREDEEIKFKCPMCGAEISLTFYIPDQAAFVVEGHSPCLERGVTWEVEADPDSTEVEVWAEMESEAKNRVETSDDLADLLLKHVPPPGWKVEIGVWKRDDGGLDVEFSAPITPTTYIDWDDADYVLSFTFEPYNTPGYPEEFGSTEEEAIENLIRDYVAAELWEELEQKGLV